MTTTTLEIIGQPTSRLADGYDIVNTPALRLSDETLRYLAKQQNLLTLAERATVLLSLAGVLTGSTRGSDDGVRSFHIYGTVRKTVTAPPTDDGAKPQTWVFDLRDLPMSTHIICEKDGDQTIVLGAVHVLPEGNGHPLWVFVSICT